MLKREKKKRATVFFWIFGNKTHSIALLHGLAQNMPAKRTEL
jgi:hypothetical protein